MASRDLWQYATAQHCNEMILSLRLLGNRDWEPARQLACLYAVSNHAEEHYRPLVIQKSGGGERRLLVPDPLLKGIQRNILRNVLRGLSLSPEATAYRKGTGILQNARPHCHQPMVMRMDIEDFFDSINFMQVYNAFPASLFPPPVRRLLAELCCYRDRLPQGAPTSPTLSNRVLMPFDRRMAGWCRKRNIRYSRYCDDMTFSGDFQPGLLHAKVRHTLDDYGFFLNEGKTRCLRPGQRQMVTGIVVNRAPQLPRTTRRALRQALYHCEKHGVADHLAHGNDGAVPEAAACQSYLASLLGQVSHLLHVNPQDEYFAKAKEQIQTWMRETERTI